MRTIHSVTEKAKVSASFPSSAWERTASKLCFDACVLVLLLTCTTSLARADAELDKFQGVWQVEKLTAGGVDAPAATVVQMVITIKDDQMTRKDDPKDVAQIKLGVAKKSGEIDLTDRANKVNRGIYRFIDKDTLEIALNLSEVPGRPRDFVSPKGTNHVVMLLKRAKN